MEQMERTELFSLQIDPLTKAHLAETAKWGRFMAIVGFIFCALIIFGGVFFATALSTAFGGNADIEGAGASRGFIGAASAIVYIIVAAIYFFPCLFLFRFSSRMRASLNSNSQEDLNLSFQNLKALFRYVGIITIIFLAIYALMFVILGMGLAMAA
jgi:hypothetical protein